MKTSFLKTAIACSFAAGSLFASAAHADAIFQPFSIHHVEAGGATVDFVADKITGNYNEIATFNPDGSFDVALYFKAGQFVTDGGTNPLDSDITGLSRDYGIYAIYYAKGTVNHSGALTTFDFTPGTGSLTLYLDENKNTVKTANPATGTGTFTFTGNSEDIVLATGKPVAGQGNLNAALSGCGSGGGSGINCGSFGSTTSFALTSPAGTGMFYAPNPFYDLSFQSGQLNNFQPVGNVSINGSLDVVFGRVPEPTTTALLGLGLLGLGFTARRRKQS